MTPNQGYLSLKESAEYLGIGESTVRKEWPSWEKFGIVPSRFPAQTLRFKKSDLDRLMDATKVS
jgi:hypothetical protein